MNNGLFIIVCTLLNSILLGSTAQYEYSVNDKRGTIVLYLAFTVTNSSLTVFTAVAHTFVIITRHTFFSF